MGNYFVEAGAVAGTWCVLCRPKYEKAPYLVEMFFSEAAALAEADELNGVNSQYFHFPWGERLKLFAVCKTGGLFQSWKPVVINLFERDARELVASLNSEQLAMIPHSTINLAEGTFLSHCPTENGSDDACGSITQLPKHAGCPKSFFPSYPAASPLKCKDCNIDLEAGTIVPFAECCTCTKDEPESLTLADPTPEEDIPPQFRRKSADGLPQARCHCGGFGVLFPAPPRRIQVRCVSCGCASASEFTEEEAIIQWNILAKASTSREKSVADLVREDNACA